jgi:hypothetical protein
MIALLSSPRAVKEVEQKSDTQGYWMPAKLKGEIQRPKSFNHRKARMWLATDMGFRMILQNSISPLRWRCIISHVI